MRGTRCCEKSNARMGGWEMLNVKNWRLQKVKCKDGRMGKVKYEELEVAKSQMQGWEDEKS